MTAIDPDAKFRADLAAAIPRLRTFARGLSGNRDLADDLAQEALVKAWAARASFHPGSNFHAWLFTILRNSFYSLTRRASRFTPWEPHLAAHTMISPADAGINIHFSDLERGLGQLPVAQREALLLVTAQGLSYEEAAAIMGCPLGTAKSRVARARTALVAFLDGPDIPGAPAPGPKRAAARGASASRASSTL